MADDRPPTPTRPSTTARPSRSAACASAPTSSGPCESASEALYIVEGPDDGAPVAFTGDLFYNGHHSYNADGFTAAWLDALDRAPALLAGIDTLYPGHGRPAGPEALDAQRRYQLMLREAVRNLADGEAALSDAAKEELTARMSAFLPDPALAWLVGLSADAVAAELAAEPQAVST